MRKGLREALERFMADMAYARQQQEEPRGNAVAAVRLLVTIRDRLGGLESALADDPTDNAPTLAAVVAAQGEAIQGLRLALEQERRERLALDRDVRTVEAVLMEERQARTGDEGWLVEPVEIRNRMIPLVLTQRLRCVAWYGSVARLFPAGGGLPSVNVFSGERVGVRPDGRLEVVP